MYPGTLGAIYREEGCDTFSVVVIYKGEEYASVTDERLCGDKTHVYIQGEDDIFVGSKG